MMGTVTFLKGRHAIALVIAPLVALIVAFFLWKASLSVAPGDVWDRPATGPELITLGGCAITMWCSSSAMGWVERTSVRSPHGWICVDGAVDMRLCSWSSIAHRMGTAIVAR